MCVSPCVHTRVCVCVCGRVVIPDLSRIVRERGDTRPFTYFYERLPGRSRPGSGRDADSDFPRRLEVDPCSTRDVQSSGETWYSDDEGHNQEGDGVRDECSDRHSSGWNGEFVPRGGRPGRTGDGSSRGVSETSTHSGTVVGSPVLCDRSGSGLGVGRSSRETRHGGRVHNPLSEIGPRSTYLCVSSEVLPGRAGEGGPGPCDLYPLPGPHVDTRRVRRSRPRVVPVRRSRGVRRAVQADRFVSDRRVNDKTPLPASPTR